MDKNEHLNCLMAEIGPIVDAESVISFGNDRWAVHMETGRVDVRHLDSQSKFVLESSLGKPWLDNTAFLSELVLTYNYLYEEHGGARIAQISPEIGWVLLFDVFTRGITSNELGEAIMRFYLVSLQWSALIQVEPMDDKACLEAKKAIDFGMSAIRP